MPPTLIYTALTVLTGGAAMAAVFRWRRTPHWDDDYEARRDTALLFVTAAAGLCLVAIRARYLLTSRSFYICSGMLVLPALIAIALTVRLLVRYRRQQ